MTALGPIPDGTVFPTTFVATGSGVVAIEGRAVGAKLTTVPETTTGIRVPIKNAVAYFGITDTTPVERRVVVDVQAKCDKCHDQLALHGGSRADNAQQCVLCHNPNNTDAQASDHQKHDNGLSADGEESIDLKRMIHAIHAGSAESNGFRENGIVVAGNDYSDVRFPGILSDCTTCHNAGTYELTDIWAQPSQNNILGTTVNSTPGMTESNTADEVNASLQDPSDDYNISPIAAVCSSCHDGDLQKNHMKSNGGVFGDADDAVNSVQSALLGITESCPVCHGPSSIADVNVVHAVP